MFRKNIRLRLHVVSLSTLLLIGGLSQVKADEIDDFLLEKMRTANIPGLQLAVVKDNKLIKKASYGLSNLQDQVTVKNHTPFPIYSMTKAFTGVAIMQLAAENKLSVNDPLSKHLDDLPKAWQPLTIRQVLSHTSGLPKILNGHWVDLIANGQPEPAWQEVLTLPMRSETNTRFEYNQTGYILLGKIIDKLSGQPFANYIQQNQLAKLDMPITLAAGFAHTESIVPNQARPYFAGNQGKFQTVQITYDPFFRTAAGMSATATELANYAIALQQQKLLDKEHLKELWTPTRLNDGKTAGFSNLENGYALGWQTIGREQHPAVSASGGDATSMVIYPEDNLTIIVLTNKLGSLPIFFIDEIAGFYYPEMKAENGWGLSKDLFTLFQEMKTQGFNQAIALADKMKASAQFDVQEVNLLGYRYVAKNELAKALEIFKLNVHLFPDNANAYDSLAETYAALGNKPEAIAHYEKVLEFLPNNQHALKQLARLKQ
ncbi:serine hydrolase domain-containing protein [Shewanella aquimarina]|uniref:serine hydrolase domain-containing protein n=1 Tax=Shewanella aquimarina TaxID=260365 RepID=UPI00201490BD|nr:serine hydrolase domain-containing protein [Shewanella aquimarina]MCL2909914.1 serine hydrolase [Shewanella aquimarina]